MNESPDTTQKPERQMRTGGSVSTTIAASPETIYDVVADVTRTGEWSDETRRVEWISAGSGVGARFKGWNRAGLFRWTRHCEVLVADRGRTFAFRTIPGKSPSKRDSTVWRFELTPEAGGTRVEQSYEIVKPAMRFLVPVLARTVPHHFDMRPHMADCLERLRVLVESSSTSESAPTRSRINLAVIAGTVVAIALAASACAGGTKVAATRDVSKQTAATPATSLQVDAADYSFDVNNNVVAAGRVPVQLHNGGSEVHQVMILRLHDGVSIDRYLAAAQSDEGAAGSLIDNSGGVNVVDPGASGTGYADFQPGKYALVCYIPSGDHVGHLHKGMVAELTVPDSAAASPVGGPTDVAGEIVMQDFSFTLPAQGLGEPGTYRFVNNGAEAHEFVVMRIANGKTIADVIPYLQAGFVGDKPITFAGGSGGVEPGQSGFVDLALSPGQYVAMCFITDPASHKHHAELGMVTPFTVPA